MSKQPYVNQSIRDEHDHEQVATRRVQLYGWDTENLEKVRIAANSDGSVGANASKVYEYTSGNLTKITKTISGTDYEKTFGYTGDDLTSSTAWSQV